MLRSFAVSSVLLLFVFLVGCDSNDPGTIEDQIVELRMEPDSVSIEPGDQVEFSLVAITESGEELEDPGLDVRWWSTDEEVFTVTEGGLVEAQGEGTAWCKAESEGLAKNQRAQFVGRDSAFVTVLF